MERAVEEGAAIELLAARRGVGHVLEDDGQRGSASAALSTAARMAVGALGRLRNVTAVPCGQGAASSGDTCGLGLAEEVLRREVDAPAG